ncbi:hypothetical protein K443DRAFT_2544 [Laccaria amethystina LaAM-08-1]|uniref:Uncharacterized protein n=1 Tax=Laccaria amethystina LaAM-08-1 TaxID=1095629 RepID=A0A0C9X4H2_9AGAR|nr:hypothetical protein K443DRAFT_2544 [Laccaria amethystina LaAM-08-1]
MNAVRRSVVLIRGRSSSYAGVLVWLFSYVGVWFSYAGVSLSGEGGTSAYHFYDKI